MIIYLSVLVALLGLAMYCFSKDEQAKAREIGRIMFFAGLLAFLFTGGAVVGMIHRG